MIGNVKRLVIVEAANVDKKAYERARELGVDIIYGTMIE